MVQRKNELLNYSEIVTSLKLAQPQSNATYTIFFGYFFANFLLYVKFFALADSLKLMAILA